MRDCSAKVLYELVFVFLLTLGLSGCGSGGDSAPQQNPPVSSPSSHVITGAGVKGPLANAVVTVFAFDATQPGFKGSVVTTASTNSSSAITGLNLSLPLNPPYIMEFTSVPGTTIDITTGVSPVITVMRTVITQALLSSGKDIYATPLTTLAVDIAVMNVTDTNGTAGIQVDEFEAALLLAASKVMSTFGFGLDSSVDIFDTAPLINNITISTSEQANVAGYRTAIEAITAIVYQISQQSAGATADIVLADFAADLADNNIIDGSSGSTLNVNTLQVLQQNPSLLFIPNTSPGQTVADVQAILAAETAITGSTTATTELLDGTIVTQPVPAKIVVDADADGVLNVDDAFPNSPLADTDTDGDGLPDVIYLADTGNDSNVDGLDDRLIPAVIDTTALSDADDDNDSWLDIEDDFPLDATRFLDPALDRDSDTVANGLDNCPLNPNPDQSDANTNGLGDVCDADSDGDGVPNDGVDNCPINANPSQIDTDADGTGDACDPDIDGDGALNANDAFPFDTTETIDTDGDGIGNNTDPDDDNDAVIDTLDTGFSPLPGGEPCSLLQDCDGDGVLDSVDADPVDPNVTINFAPITHDDMKTVNEDAAAFLIDVTANDIDDSVTLTAFAANNSSLGAVAINGNSIEYTPVANANGTDNFSYTVTDGNSSSQGFVTVTIVAVNDSPVATDDAESTNEDFAVITKNVLANDADVDGDTLFVVPGDPVATNGVVVNHNDGTFTYTPDANFNGTDSFTYTLSDGNAGISTGTVNITVNAINDLPVGNADNFTVGTTTATVLDVLANDTDVDGTLTISNVSQGSLGSTVTHNGSTVTFTDINNTTGSETFTYDVTDGATIVTGINVTMNIIANIPNTPPVASDDNVATTVDTTFFFNVLDNDTDVDGDVLFVSLPTPNTTPANGSLIYNGNGTFTYTPNTGFLGADSFTYAVTDTAATAVGTVTITVTPPGTPIDIVTLMSATEGGVAGIENAETNVYAYWTDNYDLSGAIFLAEDKVFNHLTGVFDTVVNNGDLLLSGTQWVPEGDIIGTDDGNGGLDLTILDANNVSVEVASFKLTARQLNLNNLQIRDYLNTQWQGAMVNPNATFQLGAKLITDYRFETLVESHVLAQDSSCQRDATTKFSDLGGNCNSVAVDVAINATNYAQLLSDVVAATVWVDPNDGSSTPPGAVTIATNNVTSKTLMVQLVNGGATNYYEVDWGNTNAVAFVANAVAGANWIQNTASGVEMIHFQVPASFITQFSDDLSGDPNYFLTVQNGFVRQGLKHAVGDVEFSENHFNGNALSDILANFSAPVIPGLTELTGTWVSSVVSASGDPTLIHIFANANYESSGSCELDGSTGMEYGTISLNSSTANIIASAQIATQGLCGPAQGNKTLAVNGDVLTLSEAGFADIIYNRLLATLNPIVGSWLLGNIQDSGEAHTILTVLDDTTFALSQDCTTDSVSGFEYGTYVWDQANTNDLTATLSIDSNAGCGLHDNSSLSVSGFSATVVDDMLTLSDSVGENVIFTRISLAYVIPMIQMVYSLDNLIMLDNVNGNEGEQITGSFTWSYVAGDFAGGSGQFTDLSIPGYGTDIAALTITIDIQEGIDISLAVNVHNNGVTINLDLLQPLSLIESSSIKLDTSEYEIEIGARSGVFASGNISPQITP